MVKYEPTCTYEIQSFLDKILFWTFRRYVIVKIDPRYQGTSYYKQFFKSENILSEELCWGSFERATHEKIISDALCWESFERATHYIRYNKAFSDLNKICQEPDCLRLEYSTKDYESFEDPLEKRFKELEHGKNIQAQNKY